MSLIIYLPKRIKNNIEARFNNLKESISKEILELKGKPVTKDWLILTINKFYNKKSPETETLNQYIKRFIAEITSGQRLYKGKRYQFSTIKNYTGFETQFNEYQGIYTDDRLQELKENNERSQAP